MVLGSRGISPTGDCLIQANLKKLRPYITENCKTIPFPLEECKPYPAWSWGCQEEAGWVEAGGIFCLD